MLKYQRLPIQERYTLHKYPAATDILPTLTLLRYCMQSNYAPLVRQGLYCYSGNEPCVVSISYTMMHFADLSRSLTCERSLDGNGFGTTMLITLGASCFWRKFHEVTGSPCVVPTGLLAILSFARPLIPGFLGADCNLIQKWWQHAYARERLL